MGRRLQSNSSNVTIAVVAAIASVLIVLFDEPDGKQSQIESIEISIWQGWSSSERLKISSDGTGSSYWDEHWGGFGYFRIERAKSLFREVETRLGDWEAQSVEYVGSNEDGISALSGTRCKSKYESSTGTEMTISIEWNYRNGLRRVVNIEQQCVVESSSKLAKDLAHIFGWLGQNREKVTLTSGYER